jgi:hypothetical protein
MIRVLFLSFVVATAILGGAIRLQTQTKTQANAQPKQKTQPAIIPEPKNTPLVFEPNRGQFPANVEWIAKGSGFAVGMASDGVTIEMHEPDGTAPSTMNSRRPGTNGLPDRKSRPAAPAIKFSTVKMRLAGGNGWKMEGASPTGGISNYFLGKDSAKWHTDIPQYAQAKVAGVYKGVDMVFHGSKSELEYDFVVAPGADPKQIQIQFDSSTKVRLDPERGELVVTTSTGKEMRHAQPKIYQEAGGKKTSVKGGFEIQKDGTAKFSVGEYDRTEPLVIDPTISFVRFLAGSDSDAAQAITYDPRGYSFVTGITYSNNFPVYVGTQRQFGGGVSDAFVSILDPGGNVVSSSYLGGSDYDNGLGIAVDEGGIYVTGSTGSDDFPTWQPYQGSLNGALNVFLTKLSLEGNKMVYSTYYGVGGEQGNAIAVDATQAVYIGGETDSTNLPIYPAQAYEDFPQNENTNEPENGFLIKFSPSGKTLVYATYLGGKGVDDVMALTIDSSLYAYATGVTCSTDFPYAGFHSQTYPGSCTAFVTKLSPAGDAVFYSTMLGSQAYWGTGIALDGSGNAHVAGSMYTFSSSTKTTTVKAFAAELTSAGKLSYIKLLDGTDGNSYANAIATDAAGDTWVAGGTSSSDFPGAQVLVPNPSAGFVTKLAPDGTWPLYTVLLGAEVEGVAVSKPPTHVVGLPTYATIYTAGMRYTGGHAQANQDAFVVKLSEAPVVINQP